MNATASTTTNLLLAYLSLIAVSPFALPVDMMENVSLNVDRGLTIIPMNTIQQTEVALNLYFCY